MYCPHCEETVGRGHAGDTSVFSASVSAMIRTKSLSNSARIIFLSLTLICGTGCINGCFCVMVLSYVHQVSFCCLVFVKHPVLHSVPFMCCQDVSSFGNTPVKMCHLSAGGFGSTLEYLCRYGALGFCNNLWYRLYKWMLLCNGIIICASSILLLSGLCEASRVAFCALYVLSRCVIFRQYTCQDVSSFGRGLWKCNGSHNRGDNCFAVQC